MQGDLIQPPANRRTITINPCCLLPADLLAQGLQQQLNRAFPVSRRTSISGRLGSVSATLNVGVPTVTVRCQPSLFLMINIPFRVSSRVGSFSGRVLVSGGITVNATIDPFQVQLINATVCVSNPRVEDINVRNLPGEIERLLRNLVNSILGGQVFCVRIFG